MVKYRNIASKDKDYSESIIINSYDTVEQAQKEYEKDIEISKSLENGDLYKHWGIREDIL